MRDDLNAPAKLRKPEDAAWPSPGGLTYVEVVPGQRHFECAPLRASISTLACAKNAGELKHLSCRGCQVGQVHRTPPPDTNGDPAGESHVADDPPARFKNLFKGSCSRCLAPSSRLDRSHLVADGAYCVSCFNRAREARLGRNGKGARPRQLVVRRFAVGVVAGDVIWLVSAELGLGTSVGRPTIPIWEMGLIISRSWPASEPAPTQIGWGLPEQQADRAQRGVPFSSEGSVVGTRASPLLPRRVKTADMSGWQNVLPWKHWTQKS